MEALTLEEQKQKNSNLSVLLIIINLVLVIIFFTCVRTTENDQQQPIALLGLAFVIFTGGYAFTYHGKAYRIGKWIFAMALIIGLALFGVLWYASQLGRGI
ncbi:hypothetical protein [Pedobacter rhizosphaerae]|uniref:Uncharacterized protein n=1 Tax=Pedobacter rhizosphaerae TaxID=390241 RepID=A0A1H9IPG4_9SPHI|nr:hypothetical protein [Pedobacter rhizosphaerae]SEQ76448.1 hypothetical protein SAMN04488023_10136 [Pedobacter rhizosphaerae]